MKIICAECGKEFEGTYRHKYCCDACKKKAAYRRQVEYTRRRREYDKRQEAAAQRKEKRAAQHAAAAAAPKTAPAAPPKPVILGNKMTLNEAVKTLKEYNKKHGTNLSYGQAVTKGII